MFEVLLGTRGIMQLGWATVNCQFTNEVLYLISIMLGHLFSLCKEIQKPAESEIEIWNQRHPRVWNLESIHQMESGIQIYFIEIWNPCIRF